MAKQQNACISYTLKIRWKLNKDTIKRLKVVHSKKGGTQNALKQTLNNLPSQVSNTIRNMTFEPKNIKEFLKLSQLNKEEYRKIQQRIINFIRNTKAEERLSLLQNLPSVGDLSKCTIKEIIASEILWNIFSQITTIAPEQDFFDIDIPLYYAYKENRGNNRNWLSMFDKEMLSNWEAHWNLAKINLFVVSHEGRLEGFKNTCRRDITNNAQWQRMDDKFNINVDENTTLYEIINIVKNIPIECKIQIGYL